MFKQTIKRLFHLGGLAVARAESVPGRVALNPPESMLDYILIRSFASLDGLRFIQIGANDGLLEDPLRKYVGKFHWNGLMVEPLPRHFEKLAAMYRGNSRIRLLNAAVTSAKEDPTIWEIDPTVDDLPPHAHGLGSFSRERVEEAARSMGVDCTRVIGRPVAICGIDAVLAAFGHENCDLLAIDTEGHDYEIIKLIAWERLHPRVVHFEHAHLCQHDRAECYRLLAAHGYEIATWYGDTTAWQARS